MNYSKNYEDYVKYVRTLNRSKNSGIYYEKHHIIPKALGGSNSSENMILLTAREHYLAHYLLWKIYNNNKTMYAFWRMNYSNSKKYKCNSRLYALIQEKMSKEMSRKQKNGILPEYWRQSISRATKGKNNPRAKKVINLNTLEVFDFSREADNYYGLSKGQVGACCLGRTKTAGGFNWSFYQKDKIYDKIEKPENVKHTTSVLCIETNTAYSSVKEAAKDVDGNTPNIIICCKHEYRTYKGFHWKYIK